MHKTLQKVKQLFSGKPTQATELEHFTDLYSKAFDLLEDMERGTFDRYRMLSECNKKEGEEDKNYKTQLTDMLKNTYRLLDAHLISRGIWLLFNYYSLFLDERFNILKIPSEEETTHKTEEPNKLSWYGIFGTINRDTVLKIIKDDSKAVENDIIQHVKDNEYVLYIPNEKIDKNFIKKFKKALTEKILQINNQQHSYLAYASGKDILTNTKCDEIATGLFSNEKMANWEKGCLIFSNKFHTEFADSLRYFPNFLFFKTKNDFTDEDVAICKSINELCVKLSTKLLVFENEILLDRLEDLFDSKLKRIFGELKVETTNSEAEFKKQVEKVFHNFINEHLLKIHPLIKNDLVIAFYLYWTRYFTDKKEGDYLHIEPWDDKSNTQIIKNWLTYFGEETTKLKDQKAGYFDFKEFIFNSTGEKSAIEFERLEKGEKEKQEEFDKRVATLLNEKNKKEGKEFSKIIIVDIGSLSEENKILYKPYLEGTLKKILEDMCVTEGQKEKLTAKIGDGTSPANYFSLFCHNYLVSTGYKYIYYIPSVNYDGNSSGGLSFFCKNKWPRSITKAAQDWATRFGTTFSEIEAKKIIAREILKHGTKAAMTAIMSRNLSHNIGSHVISYWNQDIEERLKKVGDNYDNPNDKNEEALKKSKDLFQYIQHRMDFLAAVSTSVPCSEMSLDIELDVLNPLIKPNIEKFTSSSTTAGKVSILLEGLAKSEGIDTLYDKIVLDISGLNNKSLSKLVSIPNGIIGIHAVYSILENFIRNAAKHYKGTIISDDMNIEEAKKQCSTAIAAIKENLLGKDNSIKDMLNKCEKENNDPNELSKIKCIIDKLHTLQTSIPFIKIVVKEPLNNSEWKKNYLVMRIWDMRENSCNLEVVEKLRSYLPGGKDYKFTDEGRIVSEALGIKEMLTCANFLRKNPPEFLLEGRYKDKKEPPLLEILCGGDAEEVNGNCCIDADGQRTESCRHSGNDYKNRYGIRLYLRKPKDMAVAISFIDENKIKKDKFEIEKIELPNDKTPLEEEIPHRMLLVESDEVKKQYENDPKAPCRIVSCSNLTEIDDNCYLELYKTFIRDTYGNIDELRLSYFNCKDKEKFEDNEYTKQNAINEATRLSNVEAIKTYTYNGNHGDILLFVYHLDKIAKEKNNQLLDKCRLARYLQPISGGYSTYVKINSANHPKDKIIREHFYLEHIESALTKVVIVDERISEWAKKNFANSVDINTILKKMNIFIVDVDLKQLTYDKLYRELKNACTEGYKVFDNNSSLFFVIHQGILDKLEEDKDKELMDNVKSKWRVVDSGRGVPPEFYKYENVRFVEISALQKLLENFDKHGLVQTLFSLRQPTNQTNKEAQ